MNEIEQSAFQKSNSHPRFPADRGFHRRAGRQAAQEPVAACRWTLGRRPETEGLTDKVKGMAANLMGKA